ncbi:urate hydroxylase PuuD [Pusillimonas sp. MFBS29]|uniref:urate hydroxylase PuuD n=1 Tax=Pusillimonas sp. MFBS29 TaxID=2886690 RepID=UPI0021034381|nr:urate hydroxylase PuuD [Pusillimonas sp. MFBS29]
MISTYILDAGNLLLRWLHVIAAIAWIGESIYFVMLDNSLRAPRGQHARQLGVHGEMWAVHGGGFYHNQKYLTNPAELPDDLHWSFWKAYTTWLSGFALFAVMYLYRPEFYLVNPGSSWAWAASLTGMQANVLAVAFLVLGYIVYSQLCRRISPTMQRDGLLSVAVGVMMVVVAYLSVHIFPGRAAFLITGALMATCMSANVFFWIIPGQRRMVAALKAGQKPDPLDGMRGKQRSVHNTYFTLPVVLLMLSNHYSFIYTGPWAWIIMCLFIFAGALIRQYFVLRHMGRNRPVYPLVGVILLVLALWLAAPASPPAQASAQGNDIARVQSIMTARCVQCHSAAPTYEGFTAPPAGMVFDTQAQTVLHATQIKQVVASSYMPLGNLTKMTEEERAAIAAWTGRP